MTKELQTLQRQALGASINLPRNTASANVQAAFSQISKAGIFVAKNIAVEAAGQKGASDAQQAVADGRPGKLAPGLTEATRAYNQAYNNVESNLVAMNTASLIDEDAKRLSAPGKLNSNSVAEFNAFAMSRIEGAIEGVGASSKAALGVKLHQHYLNQAARMADTVESYNLGKAAETFQSMMGVNMTRITEGRMSGNFDQMNAAISDADQLIGDYRSLGFMSDAQEAQARKALDDAIVSANYSAAYLESRVSGEEEAFLASLANTKPKDLTAEQWDMVSSQVLQSKSKQDRLVNEQESLSLAQWNQKLLTGEVQDLQGLEPARLEVSAASYIQLQNKVLSSMAQEAASQAKVSEFIQNNTASPFVAKRAPDAVKNAAYHDSLNAYANQKRDALQDPSYQLTLLDKAEAVQAFSVPIPEFNDELSYSLEYGGDMEAYEAALAYQQLAGTPGSGALPSPVLSVSSTAEKIAVATLFRTNFSTISPEDAIASARDAINNKDDVVRKGRLREFDSRYSGQPGKLSMQRQFKDTFGASASDNPVVFEAFRAEFRENAAQMSNADEALEVTKRSMSGLFTKSRYGRDKNELMQFAPEKNVSFVGEGHWFDNQYIIAAQSIAKNYERAESARENLPEITKQYRDIQDKINELAISGDIDLESVQPMLEQSNRLQREIQAAQFSPSVSVKIPMGASFPSAMSEQALMDEKAPKSSRSGKLPVLEIDGKNRPVFMMADPTTGNRQSGRLTYGLYYNDDFGSPQPVVDPYSESGFGEFGVIPLEEFLPETMREMNNKTIDSIARKEASAVFERDNPLDIGFGDMSAQIILHHLQKRAAGKRGQGEVAEKIRSISGDANG